MSDQKEKEKRINDFNFQSLNQKHHKSTLNSKPKQNEYIAVEELQQKKTNQTLKAENVFETDPQKFQVTSNNEEIKFELEENISLKSQRSSKSILEFIKKNQEQERNLQAVQTSSKLIDNNIQKQIKPIAPLRNNKTIFKFDKALLNSGQMIVPQSCKNAEVERRRTLAEKSYHLENCFENSEKEENMEKYELNKKPQMNQNLNYKKKVVKKIIPKKISNSIQNQTLIPINQNKSPEFKKQKNIQESFVMNAFIQPIQSFNISSQLNIESMIKDSNPNQNLENERLKQLTDKIQIQDLRIQNLIKDNKYTLERFKKQLEVKDRIIEKLNNKVKEVSLKNLELKRGFQREKSINDYSQSKIAAFENELQNVAIASPRTRERFARENQSDHDTTLNLELDRREYTSCNLSANNLRGKNFNSFIGEIQKIKLSIEHYKKFKQVDNDEKLKTIDVFGSTDLGRRIEKQSKASKESEGFDRFEFKNNLHQNNQAEKDAKSLNFQQDEDFDPNDFVKKQKMRINQKIWNGNRSLEPEDYAKCDEPSNKALFFNSVATKIDQANIQIQQKKPAIASEKKKLSSILKQNLLPKSVTSFKKVPAEPINTSAQVLKIKIARKLGEDKRKVIKSNQKISINQSNKYIQIQQQVINEDYELKRDTDFKQSIDSNKNLQNQTNEDTILELIQKKNSLQVHTDQPFQFDSNQRSL